MFSDLTDKIAIVTGGSRGIGREIVLELVRNRVKIAFNYLQSREAADQLISEIFSLGGDAIALQGDVRSGEFCKKLVDETKARYGGVHFLVNNAGIVRDKTLIMMAGDDWKDVIDTNLNGLFFLTKLTLVSFLKQRYGAIVNISSTAGILGNPGQTNYSAAKAGIIGFTKALAREVAGYGIRVNAVAPGFIRTDMINSVPHNKMAKFVETIPIGRVGDAVEVARVVSFLLSSHASYITGHVLPIDGGLAI